MSKFDAREYIKKKYNESTVNKEPNTKKTSPKNNTGFDARQAVSKQYLSQTINLDTFQSDLTNTIKSIGDAYNGWQTRETMDNTLSSVQSMYDRLGKYQEYQKQYGGTDLSELLGGLESAIGGWKDLSVKYGKYKDAKSYDKAMKEAQIQNEKLTSADVGALDKELSQINSIYEKASEYQSKIDKIKSMNMVAESRSFTAKGISTTNMELSKAEKELSEYLKSVGYDSYDSLKKTLGEKQVFKTNAQRVQDLIAKTSVGDKTSENYDKDYDKYVDIGMNISADEVGKSKRIRSAGSRGRLANTPVTNDNLREAALAAERRKNGEKSDTNNIHSKSAIYDLMTDNELKDLYYYMGKDKEDGGNRAYDYLDAIEETLNIRRSDEIANIVENTPWGELGFMVESGLDQWASGVRSNFVDKDYIPPTAIQYASGKVRDNVEYEYGDFARTMYDFGVTASNQLPSIYVSTLLGVASGGLAGAATKVASGVAKGAGLATMGISARGSAYQEMLNLGYNKDQANTYANLVGASEVGLQALLGGISKLGGTSAKVSKLVEGINNGFARFAIQFPLSVASESLEEGLQEVLTPLFTNIAAGYDTGAEVDWGEVAYSALLGGLMGGLFEGPGIITENINRSVSERNSGKIIKANNKVGDFFDILSNPEVGSAYEAYTKLVEKGATTDNISNSNLGKLYARAKRDATNTLNSETSTDEQRDFAFETSTKLAVFENEIGFKEKVKSDHNIGEKTEVTYNGEAVDIKNAKIKNGDLVVETKEGEAYVDDLTLTQSDAELATIAQGIAKTYGDDVANLFLSQYDGKTDVTAYANDFNLAVSYGKNDFTFKHMMEHKGSLTPTQVSDIYKATVIAASKEKQERINKLNQEMADKGFYKGFIKDSVIDYNNTSAEGKVNWNDLTLRQRQAVTFIKGFAQATGMNLVLEHNPNSKYGGNYNPDNNVVTIDISRFNDSVSKAIIETIIPTMSHETTHWMKEKSPELWKDLNEIVFSTLTDHYNSNTEQAIKDKIALLDRLEPRIKHTVEDARERTVTENDLILAEMTKKGKSREVSREEIIARACEDMLKMSEEGRKIFNSLSEEEQKTLVGKIKSIIKDLLTWIDEFLNSYDSTSTESRIMREYKEELQKASKIWDEMLKQSVVANQSLEKSGAYKNKVDGDVLFETRFVNGNEVVWIEENILEDNNGQPTHQFIADFIAEHIGDAYTIIESGQKVYIGEDLPGEYTQSVYTQTILQYNKNIIKAKNKAAANIKEIIEIATNRNWEEAEHTDNKDAKYGIYKYNTRFAFPVRDTNDNIIGANVYKAKLVIRNASDGKKYLYDIVSIKKDKASSNWLSKKITSPTNKAVGQKSNVSKISIHNSNPNVKTNFSAKDSTGRELSEGQMEYFKDSTVRDENGNLKVMYRGDAEEFTVFDKKKTKHSNLYGRGFYFTDSKAHAGQYGNTREFYLDIKNPLSPKQNAITKKQMLNFLKAIENDGEDYDLYNYGQDATAESVLNSVWGKGDFEMIQDINAGAIGDLVAAVELFNEINGTSYDGIVLPTETVTFDSEQAKLTSNLNPTKDKDIRFSMRDNVEETKDLVAVHNLSPEKLLKTLKLGGLPMPSIAITRAREGYNDFGEISLVFNKETIDPKFMRSNKVYSGDAWTPTYPRIEYKLNEKAQEQIKKKIDALVPRNVQSDLGGLHLDSSNMEHDLNRNGDMVSSYRYNYAMKYAFLKDNNVDIELPTMDEPLYRYGEVSNTAVISFAHKMVDGLKTVNSLLEQHSTKLMEDIDLINGIASVLNEEVLSTVKENSEEYQKLIDNPIFKAEDINLSTVLGMLESARKYFHLNGKIESKVDYKEARTLIDEKVDMAEYESWLKELFTDIVGKEGIRNNKDTYTPSGNRRSFEALHYEHNLENVIRAMKEEGTKGIGGFGGRNIFGASTNEYRSIDDIKTDAENRMQQLPESKYDEIKKGFSDRLLELASSLPIHKDSFTAIDDAANMLVEAVSKFKTKSGMANYLRTESKGWANYSDYIVDDLVELVNDIRNMPVAYFEAKPQRAVGYDEIKAVIMPEQSSYEDDLSEVKGELEKLGIPILEYEYGDNNARLKALNSLEDVRFSDREDTTVYDLMGERDRLLKENERFKADIERLKERLKIEKQVTKGNYFNENQLDAVAGHLRNISNSTYDKAELIKGLKDVYSFIAHTEQFTWEDVYERTYKLAEKMLAEAKPQKVIDDYSKMILRDIRGKKIAFSESQKNEAQYIFGKNWNRNFFGRANITDGGVSLDSQWQEWSTMYPNIFDANISDSNMVGELYDIINSLTEASETIMEYNVEEQTRWLANEIYNQYWNVSPIRTTADKYDKQIKLLNFEHRRAMKESRDAYESRLAEQKKVSKENHQKLVKELRERKDKEIARAKELGKQRLDKFKENAERKTRIQSITANALTLKKWLTKNSKDYHIHEAMKGPVTKLLTALDFSSKQMLEEGLPTTRDITFIEAFAEIKTMLQNADNMVEGLEELYGLDLAEQIDSLTKATYRLIGDNNYVINAMTIEELQSLDKLVRDIKKTVTGLNKFHVINHNQGAVNLANEFMVHGKEIGNLKKQHGKLAKFFEFRNRTPYYFFKDLGPVGQKLFRAFQDGWDKLAFNAKKVIDFANETYTSKEVKKWSNETKEFKIAQLDGSDRTFKMSIAQIMALYAVSKQKDAQRHLLSGGMTLKRIDKEGHVVADYENITLTITDIQSILSTLDERQREVADKLQGFMNNECSAWGNEISMARFGIEQFGIPNYFPIKVSEATVPTDNTKDVDNASLFRLLNMSFTKARDLKAKQSIEIGDIFDIFAQHSSDMAKYNALALPVLDFNKFYSIQGKDFNNKEYGVVKTLKAVFGDEADSYLRRFVRDLNGSQNVSRDVIGNTFFKNAKLASVAANLRVVLLQPTAYHKAGAVIDNKYLLKASAYIKVEPIGMVRKLKKAIADAEKYCGIVQWKALGYYDTDISKGITEKIKHADTIKDKVVEAAMKGAEIADKVTFGTLWIACDFEIRDTRKDLKVGSPEFFGAVAERLRDVIYATQVVDSTMTRSDMMRSTDGRDKMLTTFGSEPIIAYNMLLDMVTQINRDIPKFGKKETFKRNAKKIRKVVTAYVITNTMAALVESGFDVLRDDDDEEMDAIELLKLYFKNFAMDMSIGNKLPYFKDAYSILQGYSSSRIDTQWVQSINYMAKDVKKVVEGEGDVSKLIKDTLKAMSYVSGLPAYNAYRDLMAIVDKLGILDD